MSGWIAPAAAAAAIGTRAEMQAREEASAALEAVLTADLHHLHEGRPMPPMPVLPEMPITDVAGFKAALKGSVRWGALAGLASGGATFILFALAGLVGGHPETAIYGLLAGAPVGGLGAVIAASVGALVSQHERTKANAVAKAHNGIRDLWADREVLRQDVAAGVVSPAEAMERIYLVVPHLDPRRQS